ncbi:hypothetical protein [Kosakonia cowanii]|uniref:hypothetical protein n=1 Tax=Kosakonia cowanii TaxID=208223 RepID=UPI00289BBF3E|nr:hypothetical protein [Kosakonia cowanii]
MSLNKYGESHTEALNKIAAELAEYSHEDVIVEVKKDKNPQSGIGTSPDGPGRDRRDTGH